MINDLISIILPTYNRSSFLSERIKEFQNQTYQNWELIFINDASTDNTIDIIKSYDDNRIKLITLDKNSNNGSIPRNIGISNANGEYLCHCDDDNINMTNKLELLYNGLKDKNEFVLSYGDRITRWGKDEVSKVPDWNPKISWGVDAGQFLYRTSVYDKIPLVFSRNACDWELCKFIYDVGKFNYIPEIVEIMIFHGGNRSLDKVKCKRMDVYDYKELYNNKYKLHIVGEYE